MHHIDLSTYNTANLKQWFYRCIYFLLNDENKQLGMKIEFYREQPRENFLEFQLICCKKSQRTDAEIAAAMLDTFLR